jgi:hypothetical protein
VNSHTLGDLIIAIAAPALLLALVAITAAIRAAQTGRRPRPPTNRRR